jgi:glycosyltransferase involved in cell wall biosynthesis
VVENGCDFDEFEGLEHRPDSRFRITHTGAFFGRRDPRPFLSALGGFDDQVVARFVGDFRSSDRAWVEEQGVGERVELVPYLPRRDALALQRDSEALLLLIPEADGRGKGVISGKVFEYLAAERPILALVPPEGEAARLIRETGAGVVAPPDDDGAIREALQDLVDRWRDGSLGGAVLDEAARERLSRRARTKELAELLGSLS